MKHIFTLGILCLLMPRLSAQTTSETPTKNAVKYNQHKYEIGIDVKSLFSLQGIGTGFIFKKRIGEKKYISVYEKRALRLLLGGQYAIPTNANVDADFIGTDLREESLKKAEGSVFAGAGLEWQKQRDRVQFFYGGDLLTEFSVFESVAYSVYLPNQGNYYSNETNYRYRTIAAGLNGFGGIRFFLSPRFSLGVESGIYLGYESRKTSWQYNYYSDTNQSLNTVENEEKVGSIVWRTQFVRALYFSYYF